MTPNLDPAQDAGQQPPPTVPSPTSRWAILGIMAAVLIWGLLLALGSFLFDWNPLKPLIVGGCVLGFLALWLLALTSRQRRQKRQPPASR